MPKRTYTTQNRPVTACRECHRRKQKCDRLKPCNVCLARNVPGRCIYGHGKSTSSAIQDEVVNPLTPPSDPDVYDGSDQEIASQSIEEQFGYSALNDNAFSDLQRSIDGIYISPAKLSNMYPAPLRPHVKAKYRKIVAHLPNEFVCKMVVDIYFTEAAWYFMALDRYYFDSLRAAWFTSALSKEGTLLTEDYPRDLQHFPALLFQVLAVSLQFLPATSPILESLTLKDRKGRDRRSSMYSELGTELMNAIGRHHPSMTSVEHDMMRMSWLKNCSRGSESWHSLGTAISQAQDLELHLDSGLMPTQSGVEVTAREIWYDEYKRRVWTRLLSLDSYMAFVSGRPRHIHLDDCTARPPTNCDIPMKPHETTPAVPRNDEEPSTFTLTLFLSQLALKIHEVLSIRSRKVVGEDRREAMQRLQQDVSCIIRSLPISLQPQNPDTRWDTVNPQLPKIRQQILSVYNSFLMQLHRPYVSINKMSRDIALQATLSVLDAQQEIFDLTNAGVNQQKNYGFSFSTIDAAMLLSALVLDQLPQSQDLNQRIEKSLGQAINRLLMLKETSAVAMTGMQLLRQCYSQIQMRYPGAFFLPSTLPGELTYEGADDDTNMWEGYSLPHPQDLDLGTLPDLFDSGEYLFDANDESFLAGSQTIYDDVESRDLISGAAVGELVPQERVPTS